MADLPALKNAAIMCTAWRRPMYLERTLASWANARGLKSVPLFLMALGRSERWPEQIDVIKRFEPHYGKPIHVLDDSDAAHARPCVHTALAEAVTHIFQNHPDIDFVICGEEDVSVSDDVLEYFAWAKEKFRADQRVLCALAHNRGGQGWDADHTEPSGIPDADADQRRVELAPYFNAWVWGIWRDRWFETMLPQWDWDTSRARGYDWNIQTRIIPEGNFVCVRPEASRSQNMGRDQGYYAHADLFAGTQSKSYLEHREPCDYLLAEE